MSKMSKIDQIHLRAVMPCMSKMLKMGKEHTDTFYHTFLNMVSFECNAIYFKDVEDVMLFMSEMSDIIIIFNIQRIWLKSPKSPKSQLSKTFFGLKIR